MGKPTRGNARVLLPESIGQERQAGELKHLSSPRKGKKFDSLSSGERKGTSPNLCGVIGGSRCRTGVVGPALIRLPAGREVTKLRVSRSEWKVAPQRVIAP
jgi:hypothetical protein